MGYAGGVVVGYAGADTPKGIRCMACRVTLVGPVSVTASPPGTPGTLAVNAYASRSPPTSPCFGAYSAFSHVAACLLAEPLRRPLASKGWRLRHLRRSDTYRLVRSLAGRDLHPLKNAHLLMSANIKAAYQTVRRISVMSSPM